MNELVVDNAIDAFFGLLQSKNMSLVHNYLYELLNLQGSHDVLTLLYYESTRSCLLSRMNEARFNLIPELSIYPLGTGHWGLLPIDKVAKSIRLWDSAWSLDSFQGRCEALKDWLITNKLGMASRKRF